MIFFFLMSSLLIASIPAISQHRSTPANHTLKKINNDVDVPVLVAPAVGSITKTSLTLTTAVSDNTSASLSVKFMGRVSDDRRPFTLIGLPDTENYTTDYPDIFSCQTRWIRTNASTRNIKYAAHEGDIVNNGTNTVQWSYADTSMSILEAPMAGYPDGIPYGTAAGNHDEEDGATGYNNTFGVSRFSGRSYYGGQYGSDNLNHYDVFSSAGMEFIVVYIRAAATDAEISWANGIIAANPTKRAILVSHNVLDIADPAIFTTQGLAIYDAVKDNTNLFLMLCGHNHGTAMRTDTIGNHTITSLLADYQEVANGGDGYLRVMEFVPEENVINVKTFSPYTATYLTDASNEFTVSYTMDNSSPTPFTELTTISVPRSSSNASCEWSNLQNARTYEWYVEITDDHGNTTTGPVWWFTTEEENPVELVSFSASVNGSVVSLNWTTATEVNNYGFEVERLAQQSEGRWTNIGFVAGNGSTNSPHTYVFTDTVTAGTYSYRLKQIDRNGAFVYSKIIAAVIPFLPIRFGLEQNYPNPFNPVTTIPFTVPGDGRVTLAVFDMLGRKTATIVDKIMQAGRHEVRFDASTLSSGIYMYKLQSGGFSSIKKFVLIK
jgi:hypothetical protein